MKALTPEQGQAFVGREFGRLTVRRLVGRTMHGHLVYQCQCACGTEKPVTRGNLLNGSTVSCGCAKLERIELLTRTTHGMRYTPEYEAWRAMKKRCLDPGHEHYADYGGRGISICAAWLGSFESFHADMGSRPSAAHSLERKDNDKGYEPGNCMWATRMEQADNRRSTVRLTVDGRSASIAEWARITGLPADRLYKRKEAGWPDAEIVHGRLA